MQTIHTDIHIEYASRESFFKWNDQGNEEIRSCQAVMQTSWQPSSKYEDVYSRCKVVGHNLFRSWWPVLIFRWDWREGGRKFIP